MIKMTMKDSLLKEYPLAAKLLQSCRKDRVDEVLGILESLLKQTGLNPEEKLSLGYLRRGLALGKLRVIESADPTGSDSTNRQETLEREDPVDLFGDKTTDSAKFNKTPDLFSMSFDSL